MDLELIEKRRYIIFQHFLIKIYTPVTLKIWQVCFGLQIINVANDWVLLRLKYKLIIDKKFLTGLVGRGTHHGIQLVLQPTGTGFAAA